MVGKQGGLKGRRYDLIEDLAMLGPLTVISTLILSGEGIVLVYLPII